MCAGTWTHNLLVTRTEPEPVFSKRNTSSNWLNAHIDLNIIDHNFTENNGSVQNEPREFRDNTLFFWERWMKKKWHNQANIVWRVLLVYMFSFCVKALVSAETQIYSCEFSISKRGIIQTLKLFKYLWRKNSGKNKMFTNTLSISLRCIRSAETRETCVLS